MSAAIRVLGLRKSYRGREAVRGIDFEIWPGEVFALLGPNGAGKTSTVEVLEGYRQRTGGCVEVLGVDPAGRDRRWRQRIGIVLQSSGVDAFLTVREVLAATSALYPSPRPLTEVLDLVGLRDVARQRVRRLSGGQQRRLDLGLALVGDPDVLFLDEPTTGFDPSARRASWQIVETLCGLGKTVMLTTHYMDEAQYLAQRVAVMSHGSIVAEGPPSSLGGRDVAAAKVSFALPDGLGAADLPVAGCTVSPGPGGVAIVTDEPTRVLHQLTGWAHCRGMELAGLEVTRPTLEDVYLRLTGAPEAE